MTPITVTALLVSAILASAAASVLMYIRIKSLRQEMARMNPGTSTNEDLDRIEDSLRGLETLPSD